MSDKPHSSRVPKNIFITRQFETFQYQHITTESKYLVDLFKNIVLKIFLDAIIIKKGSVIPVDFIS